MNIYEYLSVYIYIFICSPHSPTRSDGSAMPDSWIHGKLCPIMQSLHRRGTHSHTWTQTNTNALTETRTHTPTSAQTNTDIHIHAHTHINSCTWHDSFMQVRCVCMFVDVCVRERETESMCVRTYMFSWLHGQLFCGCTYI